MHVKEANGLWKSQWKMVIKEIRPNYESELRESDRNLDETRPREYWETRQFPYQYMHAYMQTICAKNPTLMS